MEDDEDLQPTRPCKKIFATREIVVNIHGVEYDALLIPRVGFAEVDYTKYPEDDPMKRERNIEKMTKVVLRVEEDLVIDDPGSDYKLTEAGAKKLLRSL